MNEYKFIMELPIESCETCPCLQYYLNDDEYMCGIANIKIEESLLNTKDFYCPLKEVIDNVKK